MISKELEAQIVRLYHVEKWKMHTIARELGVHHSTVRRALVRCGHEVTTQRKSRPKLVDPYLGYIEEVLARYPRIPASRLFEMVRERGYPGAKDHFRHVVARLRPKPKAEAFLRLRPLAGEQAQVDWGHFGKVSIEDSERPLCAFVMVLSFSRRVYLRFFYDQKLGSFLCGHEGAFAFFGGVPRVLLYDNLKSVVLERRDEAIRFHPTMLDFAMHYRFEPRPVAIARGNEKGRVERAIRYVRSSFFVARSWTDLADLNSQARTWCEGIASDRRCPEDRTRTVREVYHQERELLLKLPQTPFACHEREEVTAGKTPYVRFDCNDYSVPHEHVRKDLVVVATQEQVRVLDSTEVVATHERCWSKGKQVEDPAHIEGLTEAKRQARRHRATDRLVRAAPSSSTLLEHLCQRGEPLARAILDLTEMLERFGAAELEEALAEALLTERPSVADVRLVAERRQHQRNEPPKVPVALPDDPRVRDLVVRPHDLSTYDKVQKEDQDEDDPTR